MRRSLLIAVASVIAVRTSATRADEDMWTFDNPPRAALKEKNGFEPSQEWIDRLRLSPVRVGEGQSGSFVPAEGLAMGVHTSGILEGLRRLHGAEALVRELTDADR